MSQMETYRHTQMGWWHWTTYPVAVVLLGVSCFVPDVLGRMNVLAAGLILGLVTACFHKLTLTDEGDWLAIRFGPIPVFRKRIAYEDVRAVEAGRSTVFDGWGIHGNLWNIWGFDCVVIRLRQRIVRIGTDAVQGGDAAGK
jgi:hypothetical protein